MYPYTEALRLIKTFEGFNERAYADPETGAEPYTFGYGSQFYPDGTPVKQGHCVTKEKAMEYLVTEVETIAKQLLELNLGLDQSMINALISFVHSIGWDAFLYSNIIDRLEEDDYGEATQDMSCWIFDIHHQVIGGLIDRRRHEIKLFLSEQDQILNASRDVLLKTFREYSGSKGQVAAIRRLQECMNPYTLSAFANDFNNHTTLEDFSDTELQAIYQDWK